MLSIVNTIALNGTEGTVVEAQVDLSAGIPHWDMVGMLGTSIKESKRENNCCYKKYWNKTSRKKDKRKFSTSRDKKRRILF